MLYRLETGHILYTSTVVAFELWAGAVQVSKQQEVQELLRLFTILPFHLEIAEQAATIYRDLRNRNQVIEIRDVFIAATAVVYEMNRFDNFSKVVKSHPHCRLNLLLHPFNHLFQISILGDDQELPVLIALSPRLHHYRFTG
jgi:tRNA(fMet)-specific endonuclease VapC